MNLYEDSEQLLLDEVSTHYCLLLVLNTPLTSLLRVSYHSGGASHTIRHKLLAYPDFLRCLCVHLWHNKEQSL